MADETKDWLFFDANSGLVPDELSPSLLPDGGKGRVVALAATPFAREGGWADQAVVAIAKSWSLEDLRIFLMDLGLENPSLHDAMGLLNKEGVSDAFLYGASIQRIAQPALNEAIFFAPAGTITSDPEQILGHSRWNDLAGGFSEADATLLLFLPTDIPGAHKILSWVTDILFLSGEEELPEDHLGPASIKVACSFGPERSPTEEVVGPGEMPEQEDLDSAGIEEGSSQPAEDLTARDEAVVGDGGFGFEQGISLVEGFVRAEGIEAEGTGPPLQELEGLERSGDVDVGEGPPATPRPGEDPVAQQTDSLPPTAAAGDSVRAEPGAELLRGGPDLEEPWIPPSEAPDFGVDFVEMPEMDEDTGIARVLDSREEVVRSGPDFGPDHTPGSPDSVGVLEDQPSAGKGAPAGEKTGEDTRPRRPDRPRPRRRPPPKKFVTTRRAIGGAITLVLLIAGGGTATGLFNFPGFMWLQKMFYEVPPPPLTLEGPEASEPILRFSLELPFAQDDLPLAMEMRNTLRNRRPDLLFYVSPTERDGDVRYVLYAGPAADLVDIENLRRDLEDIFNREESETWPAVVTTRAFYLGERGSLEEAQGYLSSLEEEGVLGYILHVTYPDNTEGFVIYSGAYEGIDDARWWQLALRDSGFRDVPLIERRGRLPE